MDQTIAQITSFLKILERYQEGGLQPYFDSITPAHSNECVKELAKQAEVMSVEAQVKTLNIMCVDSHYVNFKTYWLLAMLGDKTVSREIKQERLRELDAECQKRGETPLIERFDKRMDRALIKRYLNEDTERQDSKDRTRVKIELEVTVC